MKRWVGLLACLLMGWSFASAGEVEELRERAGQLKQKAAALLERGEKAEAQRLIAESKDLAARAEMLERREKERNAKPQPRHQEEELQRLHARLKELHEAHRDLWAADAPDEELVDIRFHIRKVEELIAARQGKRHPAEEHRPTHPKEALQHLEGALQRIEHLRVAADHLQAADMTDMAHHLRERSAEMEREARAMLDQIEKQSAKLPPAPQPAVKSIEHALREEVEALRKEIETLRKQRRP